MTLLPQSGGEKVEPHLPKDLKELGELAHLLFEWPIRRAPRLALPACIFIASILQAGMIILFSISYTTPSEVQPFSPQIYFIPPDSAAARQLAPWLAANDPAVFSPQYDTQDALPAPPPLKYRPSYEEPPPPLRPLPREKPVPIAPPSIPKMADIMSKKTHHLSAAASSVQAPPLSKPQTLIHWQDDLATRTLMLASGASAPPLPIALSPSAQPSLYEVEVSEEGVPLHSILIESSGDPPSDEAGSIWIHAQRFRPAVQASWGRVLLIWGAPSTSSTNTIKS